MISLVLLLGLAPTAVAVQDPAPAREILRETYPDGRRRSEGEAVRASDGSLVLDGKYSSYHPDGSRESVGRYRAGRRQGSWRFLHPGGDPKRAEGNFKDGWRDGDWKAWTPNGKFDPLESGTYRVLRVHQPDGTLRAEGETLRGVPHGRWELHWASGAPMAGGELRRGRMQGVWLFRHADGTLDGDWIGGVYEGGERVRSLAPEELPPAVPIGPAAEATAAPAAQVPTELSAAVERLREALRGGTSLPRERDPDLALLLQGSRANAQLLLAEVEALDLADAEQARFAGRWERDVLRHLAQGADFGLRAGVSAEDQAWNRLCLRRWRSLLALAEFDPWFLDFEVAHPYRRTDAPPSSQDPREGLSGYLSLHSPDLPLPGLDSEEARAVMHASVAARLPGRRQNDPTWGKAGAEALDQALRWLVDHQAPDGRFASANFSELNGLGRTCACDGPGDGYHDVGITGLALLALLGDGNSPRHGRHSAAVRRGVSWLLDQQDPATGLLGGVQAHGFIYDHAIATFALCEAAASCDGPRLRLAAQAALDVCARARNPYSAWRYGLVPDNENDTSITGWMVSALHAGRLAGLQVPEEAFLGAIGWIETVTEPSTGRCGYDSIGSLSARIPEVNDRFPSEGTEAMTAVALHCRQRIGALGSAADSHAKLLLRALPVWSPGEQVDYYYWYYGSQAMAFRGGSEWAQWSKALGRALLDSQRKDGDFLGSWDAVDPWSFAGGRIYATALAALCLEAPFRSGALSAAR
jgi:hypothetical protein